ncbi:MAG: ornithine carbamoyltransferase [Succinivibrionaceae bacterium]|nr:ornithine carbamoyltransferase [Succinivibrionaceae bacterium]
MNQLLTGLEPSCDDYQEILSDAAAMKANPAAFSERLKGRSGVIMFEKPSLRTRTTFELAFFRLGGHGVYLDLKDGELGKRETIADYARNLTRWTDCLVARVFAQRTLEELARHGTVPVINALSDLYHPAQAMADFLTVREHLGELRGLRLAYLGDGNNVTNSLLIAGAKLGVSVTCFCPRGSGPDVQAYNDALEVAKATGACLEVRDDPQNIGGFDAIYTDTWVSMGDNTPLDSVIGRYGPYRIDQDLLDRSGARIVLHCLPAHRGYEITDEVMDGEKSVVFDEAENRLHIHMAVLDRYINRNA